MLHTIASAFIGVALFISSLFGVAPAQAPSLGAALPSGTAVFETSLQSRISSTDTSLTLVANSVRGGSSLSGFQCFTVDEGRTDAEYICGTVSGTSVTGLTRGIDPATGTTSNSALKFAHRVGADVKITDFPVLEILRNQAAGADTYSNTLHYAAGVTPTATGDLTDKEYVDGVAFSGAGVIDASSVAKGVVELATQVETASSTSAGSSGNLAIPASNATSTYNSATAPLRVVVTQNSGKIDDNFVSTSTLFATSSIASGPIGYVGKNIQVFASTGTTTFSVPSGIKKVSVETCGAGGGGGGGGNGEAGFGGAAGGCAIENVDVTGTTSIQLFVGTGGTGNTNSDGSAGTWSTFGTNGFYNSASGGTQGWRGSSVVNGITVAGGVGSGGDLNLPGGPGSPGFSATKVFGGNGGSSLLSGGASGAVAASSATAVNGSNASGCGGGGGGGATISTGGNNAGGTGANGCVIVRW